MGKDFIIFSNLEKDPDREYLDKVADIIIGNGGSVSRKMHMGKNEKIMGTHLEQADIIISLGGDGTFLNIARQVYQSRKPILGINIGSLGFLSEIEFQDLGESIADIMKGNYTVLKRMMLQATIFRDGKKMKKLTALNDIVISRGEMSKIVRLSILINGSYVDTFPGDGIVVSTPTGSTGYSLSAGGPVVDHREKLIIITPICPHTMHARSFITSELSEVAIDVMETESFPCILTSDGQKGFDLQGKDRVLISKSIHSVHVIRMNKNGFYETLRNKIYYRSK